MVLEKKQGDYTVKIDRAGQILKLDIPEESDYGESDKPVEAEIYPSLKELIEYNRFLSASIISAKAKQFDDGLYGAVEVAAENGTGKFRGKKAFLSSIYSTLKKSSKDDYSTAFILAALSLGGEKIENIPLADNIKNEFLSDPFKSKPLGFYTWNDELKGIFRQDRLLQSELQDPPVLAEAILDSGEKLSYSSCLKLMEKLTNPLTGHDLRPLIEKLSKGEKPVITTDKFSFFPPSLSYETELLKKLYGNSPVPEHFNLADKLIEEIKKGNLNISPKENSGWYDYQTWSLEPLLLPDKFPESKKVEFGNNYKKELIELFKSLLALTRETHIKQLEIPMAGCAPPDEGIEKPVINIYPDLTVEPLSTYYLRKAKAYDFIHKVLVDNFGEEGLKKMHRLTSDGPVKESLSQELTDMKSLFYGAYLISASETGFKGEEDISESYLDFTRKWIEEISSDSDLMKDSRMMVPVFYDIHRKKTKVWVFPGYEKKPLTVEYKKRPAVTVITKDGKILKENEVDIIFNDVREELIYPVFAEIYVNKILNREEFRALCDKYRTRTEILNALK